MGSRAREPAPSPGPPGSRPSPSPPWRAPRGRRPATAPATTRHPLRRLNSHDCVVLVEKLFALGRGALLDAMPSPRLVCTHMPLSVLPPSIAGGDSCCKIVYICRYPVWDHIIGYWRASKAEPDRVLFLTYEDVLQDPASAVRKLAGIVELCSLESLRGQKANKEGSQGVSVKFSHDSCFRKGVVGDWKNYMTPEMGGRLDAILREKFEGSGLTLV